MDRPWRQPVPVRQPATSAPPPPPPGPPSPSPPSSSSASPTGDDVITEKTEIGVVIRSPTSIELTPKLRAEDFDETGSAGPMPDKVILTYIPTEVSESEVRALCAACGELKAFNLVIDRLTGERRGYAFAEYVRPLDALKACNDLNGFNMLNKRIKVSFARPQDPSIRNANLHISGWPRSWSIVDLYNYFRFLGQVIACKILTDPITRNSKGIAFVRFATHQQADDARALMNGIVPTGEREPLIITYAHANGPNAVRRLPPPLVPGVNAPADSETPPNSSSPEGAAEDHQPSTSQGPFANAVLPPGGIPNPKRRYFNAWPLFVGNLGEKHDETFLKMVFEQYGAIESVKIMKVGGPKGGGFGFVNMWNAEECIVALQHLHNFKLAEDHYLTVQIKSFNARPPGSSSSSGGSQD